jgi:release factor glutamine methyltransferase
VLESEKEKMQTNVLKYEPNLALFVADNDPLIFYKKIGVLAEKSLNCGGKLYFEINEKYGAEILEMLSKIGFVDIALKKDINDKDRMVKATKK